MNKISEPIMIILSILFSVGLGYELRTVKEQTDVINPESKMNSDILLFETVVNISDDIKSFYHYNKNNSGKNITDEQLKIEGGVCMHYAEYAAKKGDDMGLNSKTVIIWMNSSMKHEFAVLSNEEGYCIIDQTYINCVNMT